MVLNTEKNGEQDKESSQEWLVNMDPGIFKVIFPLAPVYDIGCW